MILEVKQWPESQEIMDDPEWFFIVDGGKELTLGDSAYIDSRMDEGIKKFRQEMPLEFYTVNDILEEVVDACIYASSLLIKIDGAYKRILKEENK